MRVFAAILVAATSLTVGLAQPVLKTPVSTVNFLGLTATTVIDNRSPTTRASNVHTVQASGTGTWSAQLQYSDTSATGPWTNFSDPTSVLSNTSQSSTGGAYGYHDYIRILITGAASVNYAGTQNLYIPFGSSGGSGSGPLLQTNGSTNINQTLLNIQNSSYQGLTVTATNPSGGIVQLGLTGTLNNPGLTNSTLQFVVPSWLSVNSPVSLGGTMTISPTVGQTAGRVIGTCGVATIFGPCQLAASDITTALAASTSINGTTIPSMQTLLYAGGPLATPSSGIGTFLTGIPLGTGITAIFSAPLNLTSNTLSCPTCVTASSPGAGIAHFAGSTQAVTSSLVSLTADVTGVLPAANLPTATSAALGIVQGDGSTLTISAGVISCTTATNSQIGCARPDNSTITISGGVLTANVTGMTIGGSVGGGATGNVLYVGPGSVLAQEVTLGAARFPAMNGDITNSPGSLTTTVKGINSVPFCTGFAPTTGQALEYITGGSPNPCYTAVTISGGGNVSTSGTPAQYQIPVWVTSTTIGGVSPSATVGVPLISQGPTSNPAFGAINLAGGASIVSGQLPGAGGGTGINNGSSTLAYAGNIAFTGPFTFTATLTANTNVTFPITGTLSTTTGTVTNVSVAGGILSVANPTSTPAITVAGTSGGVPCFTSASAWASSAVLVSGQFMLGGGAGACPATSFSVVPLANGGTNAGLVPSIGGLVYSTATALAVLAGTATANKIPLSGASAAPAWSTATYPATTTINQVLYSSAANTITGLATANSAVFVTSAGGVPSLSTTLPNALAMGTPASINLTNATNYPQATASTFGIVKPDNTTVTIVGGVISASGGGGGGGATTFTLQNAGTTGTTAGALTKAVAGLAVIAATSDVNGIIGITTAGAGTTGNATITYAGAVSCLFDAATTAGDYVTISITTAGDCHDAGANPPTGQVIGRVWGTNGSAGTYTIDFFPPSNPPLGNGTGITLTYSASGISVATSTLIPTHPTIHAGENSISSTNGTCAYTAAMPNAALTVYTVGMTVDLLADTTCPTPALVIDGLASIGIYQADGVTAGAVVANQPQHLQLGPIGCTVGSTCVWKQLPGASAAVSSFTGDGSLISNSGSTGGVVVTLATAGAYNVWSNNTNATAAPGYHSIINAMLPGAGTMNINGITCTLGSSCSPSGGGGTSSGGLITAPGYSGVAQLYSGPLLEYTSASVVNPVPYGQYCGSTSACSHIGQPAMQIVYGSAALVSGTPSAVTVTGLAPTFNSTTSFLCTVTDATAAANGLLKVVNTSASSITITGPNTITDVVNYICVGY